MSGSDDRHRTMLATLAAVGVLAAAVLFQVIGTVFLAITAAYLLIPTRNRLHSHGVPRRIASVVLTGLALLAALLPIAAISFILYRRRQALLDVLATLPQVITLEVGTFATTVRLSDVYATLRTYLSTAAVEVLGTVPILALKLSLFVFLLYALLVRGADAAAAITGAVPPEYHDVLHAFHRRIRQTLYAIYVLQVATSFGTFVIALPILVAFGYPFVFTLAFLAAVLQFLPIVGPSLLVLILGLWEFSADAPLRGIGILVIGLIGIAGLPDLLIRPRLASETSGLSGALYFIGFVGGILTLGPVGIVAGPLVVALLAEATQLVSAENHTETSDDPGDSGS